MPNGKEGSKGTPDADETKSEDGNRKTDKDAAEEARNPAPPPPPPCKRKREVWTPMVAIGTLIIALTNVGVMWYLIHSLQVQQDALQVQQDVADRLWDAQLITTIYDTTAKFRVREEAVKAYLALRRRNGRPVDLRGADLTGMTLWGEDFSDANLIGANLSDSDFTDANFNGAKLGDCDRPQQNQFGAGSGESAGVATLRDTDFARVQLENTFLCGVDLRQVKHLSQDEIEKAKGDGGTLLPQYLRWPTQWPPPLMGPPAPAQETGEPDPVEQTSP